MLRFRKVTSVSLKIGKLLVTLATSNIQTLFVTKFDSKSSLFEIKKIFEGIYQEKNERGGNASCVKYRQKNGLMH